MCSGSDDDNKSFVSLFFPKDKKTVENSNYGEQQRKDSFSCPDVHNQSNERV